MRLFVGVELSEETKAAAAMAAGRLQAALTHAALAVDARWVPAANLHITLSFIGEVDEARAARITEALNTPFSVGPFTLRTGGLGAFPPSGPPRVLWMGLTEGSGSLTALHAQVAARLEPHGVEREHRRYSAHLTIARVKDVPSGSSAAIRRLLGDCGAEPTACAVDDVTLFRSRVSSRGATYEPLLRIPLI